MKPLAALTLTLLLTGCRSTWNDSNRISPGMSKAELIAAIGQPEDSISPGDGVEILRYHFIKYRTVRIPPAVPLKKVYLVRLESGHVTTYGTERDLAKAATVTFLDPREKTININVTTTGNTNAAAIAPIEPRLNLP